MAWNATLAVDYGRSEDRTRITRLSHNGPLVLQKSFYPDASGMVHNYVLHPSGGLVGGDHLSLNIGLREQATALLTTPAAGKIYRTPWQPSGFKLQATVDAGCELLWLPQENIVYEGAHHRSELNWIVHPSSRLTAWDIQCLGRPGSGKVFDQGRLFTQMQLRSDTQLLYLERQCFEGGSAILQKPWGLAGHTAFGSMLLHWPDCPFLNEICGDQSLDGVEVGITKRDSLLIARARAACPLLLRERFLTILKSLYAQLPGGVFSIPRIWAY